MWPNQIRILRLGATTSTFGLNFKGASSPLTIEALLVNQKMSKKGGAGAVAAASTLVKLLVPAGKASAQPPVGPALGAKGVKAME